MTSRNCSHDEASTSGGGQQQSAPDGVSGLLGEGHVEASSLFATGGKAANGQGRDSPQPDQRGARTLTTDVEEVRALSKYLPQMVIERILSAKTNVNEPMMEEREGALFFIDISGYVKLAAVIDEHIQKRERSLNVLDTNQGNKLAGFTGEELRNILNQYFSRLVNIILAHGGDVLKFAGDAIFALWPVERVVHPEGYDDTLTEAVTRAVQCAMEVQSKLHGHPIGIADRKLSCKVVISAGTVRAFHVGGVNKRFEFFISGPPLKQVQECAFLACPRDILLSQAAKNVSEARVTANLSSDSVVYRVSHVHNPVPQMALPNSQLSEHHLSSVKQYVPNVVKQARRNTTSDSWLTEIRIVTVVFGNFTGIDYDSDGALELVQHVLSNMQKALYDLEGHMRQFIIEDKGSTLIGAFGMPNLSHEDDAYRGAMFAIELQKKLAQEGVKSEFGVTTGPVFTGSVGSKLRCEYSITGDTVNLAARLMAQAAGGILCDTATYQASKERVHYQAVGRLKVKGKMEGVEAFRPLGPIVGEREWKRVSERMLCGRTSERVLIGERLQATFNSGKSKVVLLDGPVGVGKTALLTHCSFMTENAGFFTARGFADPLQPRTLLLAWRPVVRQLLGLRGHYDAGDADSTSREVATSALRELSLQMEKIDPRQHRNDSVDLPHNRMTAEGVTHPSQAQMSNGNPVTLSQDGPPTNLSMSVRTFMTKLQQGSVTDMPQSVRASSITGTLAPSHYQTKQLREPNRWQEFIFAGDHRRWEWETDTSDARKEVAERISDTITSGPAETEELVPLIGTILGEAWTETEATKDLTGSARTWAAIDLLFQVVIATAKSKPMAIIMDDCQWMDTASWTLAEMLGFVEDAPVFIVISCRCSDDGKVGDSVAEHLKALLHPSALWLHLYPFSKEDIEQLMLMRLGCHTVPRKLIDYVYSKSEGNPLFAKELIKELVDAGKVEVMHEQRKVVMKRNEGENEGSKAGSVPGSMESMLKGKIDRLSAPLQICAKFASVIGVEFDLHLLKSVAPPEIKEGNIDLLVQQLIEANILHSKDEKGQTFEFRHPMMRSVAYSLIPSRQRRSMHQAIAAKYEVIYSEDVTPVLPLLAYHWNCVGHQARAINLLESAAENALREFAYLHAVSFLSNTLNVVFALMDRAQQSSLEKQSSKRNHRSNPSRSPHSRLSVLPGDSDDSDSFQSRMDKALAYAGPVRGAKWFRMMAEANLGMGMPSLAVYNLFCSSKLLSLPVSSRQLSLHRMPEAYLIRLVRQKGISALVSFAVSGLGMSMQSLRRVISDTKPRKWASWQSPASWTSADFMGRTSTVDESWHGKSVEYAGEMDHDESSGVPLPDPPTRAFEIASTLRRLAEIDHFNKKQVVRSSCRAIVAAYFLEFMNFRADMAATSAFLCLTFMAMQKKMLARECKAIALNRQSQLAGSLSAPGGVQFVHMELYLGIYDLGEGRWKEACQRLHRCQAQSERLGDIKTWEKSMSVSAFFCLMHGDLDTSLSMYSRVHASGQQRGDRQTQSWALLGMARVSMNHGMPQDTLSLLNLRNEARGSSGKAAGLENMTANAWAERAYALMQSGNVSDATEAIGEVFNLLPRLHDSNPMSIAGLKRAAGVLFTIFNEAVGSQQPRSVLKEIRALCVALVKRIKTFALSFPIAYPRYYLYRGIILLYSGRRLSAMSLFNRAVNVALEMDWNYERACIQLEIANHLPPSENRLNRLEEAIYTLSHTGDALHRSKAEWLHEQTSQALAREAEGPSVR